MLTINITQDQVDRAESHYGLLQDVSLRGSITKGKGNIYGALGEVVVYDLYNKYYECEFINNYDYDLIIDGDKIDVKTKRTTVRPSEEYNCSISAFNTTQKCDFYVFVRITEDKKKAYVLGYKKKASFFKQAEFGKKGQVDPDGNGKWVFKDDCYNLKIKLLRKTNFS